MRAIGMMACAGVAAAMCVPAAAWGGPGVDPVISWNRITREAVRVNGGPPGPTSRAYQMVQAAVYDAVNAIERQRTHLAVNAFQRPEAVGTTSREAAVIGAAHRVLTDLFPAQSAFFDAERQSALNALGGGAGVNAGLSLGEWVGGEMLALRANDGSQNPDPPYPGGTQPGQWRPTAPYFAPAAGPLWGSTTAWTLASNSQFRPAAPPDLTSAAYTASFNEVKEFGRVDSAVRTQDQTDLAIFWANDRNGTYKPMGQYNDMVDVVARQQGNTLYENALLFAMANTAMADAGVSCWDAKYHYSFWRPITGITDTMDDGNPLTITDPTWEPLAKVLGAPETPPFPAYTSGHSTFGAATARVLALFYGTDDIAFTLGTDENSQTRSFTSLSAAAWENAISRVYLGVHWDFDAVEGVRCGNLIGDWVMGTAFQVPTPGASALLGGGLLALALRRRR